MIAQSLVVENKLSNLVRELFTLPSALSLAGLFAVGFKRRGLDGSDCVSCGAEFVRGNMRDNRRLASSIGSVPS